MQRADVSPVCRLHRLLLNLNQKKPHRMTSKCISVAEKKCCDFKAGIWKISLRWKREGQGSSLSAKFYVDVAWNGQAINCVGSVCNEKPDRQWSMSTVLCTPASAAATLLAGRMGALSLQPLGSMPAVEASWDGVFSWAEQGWSHFLCNYITADQLSMLQYM